MTTKITLDIETFNTPSLKRMAYALLEGGPEMLRQGERREVFMAVRQCIAELSSRANQGDISELNRDARHLVEARKSTQARS